MCLCRNGSNCMNNSGQYIDTWADDSNTQLAQSLTLDAQCNLLYGAGFTYCVKQLKSLVLNTSSKFSNTFFISGTDFCLSFVI